MLMLLRSSRRSEARQQIAWLAAAVTFGCAALLAAPAHAGTYHLLECHDWGNSWAVDDSSSWAPGNVNIRNDCQNSSAARRLFGLESKQGNPTGVVGQYQVHAPGGLAITAARAQVKLRRGNGLRAQFGYWISTDFHPLYTADPSDSKWVSLPWYDVPNGWSVGVRLICMQPTCPKPSHPATAFMSHVELKIYDKYKPIISTFAGSLVQNEGWLRGVQTLKVAGYDVGAGLILIRAAVNGSYVMWDVPQCYENRPTLTWPIVKTSVPCYQSHGASVTVDTNSTLFENGCVNRVTAQAQDYTGAWSQSTTSSACVDNIPPKIAFANSQDPSDPELITAGISDSHSGVAADSGEISVRRIGSTDWHSLTTIQRDAGLAARVDSASFPPGDYEFRAKIGDVAGNESTTTKRANGSPMRLRFPLRAATDLDARLEPSGAARQTVPYGEPGFVAGRLTSVDGESLLGEHVTIIEHFGDGALIRKRVTHVRTDEDGRWDAKLPAGPSRHVTATYGGSRRYLGDDARAGLLLVRSRTTLKPSRRRVREGQAVVFRGSVRRKGARIPVGGKLVELQVRVGKRRWDTVKRPFYTRTDGRWRMPYRFGRFYTRNVRYRFRARVLRESDWPYRPVRSKQRTVTVMAR